MKNITLSADDKLIAAARARAQAEQTTLNEQFRRWLTEYVSRDQQAQDALSVIQELRGQLRVGHKLTREEMNER
jgi:hypothetical protein